MEYGAPSSGERGRGHMQQDAVAPNQSHSPSHVLVCVASDRSADNGQPTDSLSEIAQREGRAEHVATGGGRARPAVGRCHVP